jgi:hypothetical protein
MAHITDRDVETFSRLLSSALNVLSRPPFVNRYLQVSAIDPQQATLQIDKLQADAVGLADWMVKEGLKWADKNQEP